MKPKAILSLVLIVCVVAFALQNANVVSVRFLFWELALSQALLIFLAFVLGMAAGMLGLAARRRRSR